LLRRTAPLLVGVFGWGQSTQAAVWPELVVQANIAKPM